jgi:alanine-glyoxylate transaminase/serine-glyoxylate transaminase/serine-pyruvate transaminase
VEQVRAPVGAAPSLGEIARAFDGRHFKLVAVTHVDTSTGVLAPVEPIARMACERGTLSLVDAVCSAAGEELRQEDWGVDVAVTASQKAMGVPPGLAIASVGARALAAYRARRHPVRTFTCDWGQWLPVFQAYERGEAAYFATPPVNLVNALERSLASILEEGVEPRVARHDRMALALRAGWRSLQLELVPRTDDVTAHTMSALYYPAGADASLLARIRDEGVIVAGGLHPEIKPRYFRVGHMGSVSANDVLATVGAVGRALRRMGARVDVGAAVGAAEQAIVESEIGSDQ